MRINRRQRFYASVAFRFLTRLKVFFTDLEAYGAVRNHLLAIKYGNDPRVLKPPPDLADDRGLLPDDPVK